MLHLFERPDSADRPGSRGRLVVWVAATMVWAGSALAQDAPKRYALLIGLNNYLHVSSIAELQFAQNDVEALEERLEDSGFDEVMVLVNDDAKRSDILAHLYRYAQIVREQDTFVLFFAGHGVQNSVFNDETYWLTFDADLDPLDESGIRLSHLLDFVRDIRASKKLLLLDHCFSGQVAQVDDVGPDGRRNATGGGFGVDATGERGSVPANFEARLRAGASGADPAKGMVILAAARAGAQESAALKTKDRDGNDRVGHGLFTYTLLQALGSRDADLAPAGGEPDGRLTLAELVSFLRPKMSEFGAAHGLGDQALTEVPSGRNLSTWELVSSLPIDDQVEREQAATDYEEKLRDWEDRSLIDFTTKIECIRVVTAWKNAAGDGPALSPVDTEILDEIRKHLDSDAPESVLGPDLQFEIERLRGGA